MKRAALFGAVVLIASILIQASGTASAAVIAGDWRFQDDFASSVPGAPSLNQLIDPDNPQQLTFATESVNGQSRRVLRFPFDHGLSLSPATPVVDPAVYSMALLFRFDEVDGFNSVVNVKGGNEDAAYYVAHGGRVQLWPGTADTDAAFVPNVFHQLIVTRDEGGNVTFYIDGVRVHDYLDSSGYGVLDTVDDSIWFFRDGGGVFNEASAGSVARIRIWNGILTESEVAALDDHGPGPGQGGTSPAPECERDPEAQCGTTGDDTVSTDDGRIITGAGNDTIEGTVNSNTSELIIDAGGGADRITLTFEDTERPITVRVIGGGGKDVIVVPRNPGALVPNLKGGGGNDVIKISSTTVSPRIASQTGSFGRYVINSGSGNDRVTAGITADRIKAAAGNDVVDGGAGDDKVDAGGGKDELEGGSGDDTLDGGDGDDLLHGGNGINDFAGGPGNDTCLSDTRRDQFSGCERIRRNHRRNHQPI